MPRSSPYAIELSSREREALESRARKYTSPYRDVVRARAILLAAEGLENQEIAGLIGMPRQLVSKWRKRFFEERLAGLEDRPRGGRPSVFPPSPGGGG
jgi:transposase